jgi:ubiquinone/menaquinone biosynthesis C-methylase UbiE
VAVDTPGSGHVHVDSEYDVLFDGQRLPFADQVFDVVLATEVFEHVVDLDGVLAELKRVLRPGGKLLVTAPFLYPEHELPTDYRRFTQNGLVTVLSKHGFRQESKQRIGNAVETLALLTTRYAYQMSAPRWIRGIVTFLCCSLFNTIAVALGRIVPNCDEIYIGLASEFVRGADCVMKGTV